MLSEFDNVWNQLALELARPTLCPEYVIDSIRVEELRLRLEEAARRDDV